MHSQNASALEPTTAQTKIAMSTLLSAGERSRTGHGAVASTVHAKVGLSVVGAATGGST